jgi:hypothetical protein
MGEKLISILQQVSVLAVKSRTPTNQPEVTAKTIMMPLFIDCCLHERMTQEFGPGMVVHVCNPSTGEPEARGS